MVSLRSNFLLFLLNFYRVQISAQTPNINFSRGFPPPPPPSTNAGIVGLPEILI